MYKILVTTKHETFESDFDDLDELCLTLDRLSYVGNHFVAISNDPFVCVPMKDIEKFVVKGITRKGLRDELAKKNRELQARYLAANNVNIGSSCGSQLAEVNSSNRLF